MNVADTLRDKEKKRGLNSNKCDQPSYNLQHIEVPIMPFALVQLGVLSSEKKNRVSRDRCVRVCGESKGGEEKIPPLFLM